MTKQGIREGIMERIVDCPDVECVAILNDDPCGECKTNAILTYLHSQGVVLIVDSKGHESQECDWCYWSTHRVEPLIEEGL